MGLAPDWQTMSATSGHAVSGQRTRTPKTSATQSARLRDSRPSEKGTHAMVHEQSSADGGSSGGATDTDGVVISLAAFADDPDVADRDAIGTISTASTQAIEPLTWDVLATPQAVSRPVAGGLPVSLPQGEDSVRTAQSQTRDGSSSHRSAEPGIKSLDIHLSHLLTL